MSDHCLSILNPKKEKCTYVAFICLIAVKQIFLFFTNNFYEVTFIKYRNSLILMAGSHGLFYKVKKCGAILNVNIQHSKQFILHLHTVHFQENYLFASTKNPTKIETLFYSREIQKNFHDLHLYS